MSDYYYYKRYKKYKNLYKNLRAGGEEGSDKPVTKFDSETRVKIKDLSSEKGQSLNGKTGKIRGDCPDHQGRCFVLLDNIVPDKQPGGIKPENLELETSESEDSGSEDSGSEDSEGDGKGDGKGKGHDKGFLGIF